MKNKIESKDVPNYQLRFDLLSNELLSSFLKQTFPRLDQSDMNSDDKVQFMLADPDTINRFNIMVASNVVHRENDLENVRETGKVDKSTNETPFFEKKFEEVLGRSTAYVVSTKFPNLDASSMSLDEKIDVIFNNEDTTYAITLNFTLIDLMVKALFSREELEVSARFTSH